MAAQNLGDAQQADSLPVGFGGEKGGEQAPCNVGVDSRAVVVNFDGRGIGGYRNGDAALVTAVGLNALHGVFHDIDDGLFEEHGVDIRNRRGG